MEETTKSKFAKILKGAVIAGGGVAVTYFLQSVGSMDFGAYSPVVTGISAILINAVREWSKKYE